MSEHNIGGPTRTNGSHGADDFVAYSCATTTGLFLVKHAFDVVVLQSAQMVRTLYYTGPRMLRSIDLNARNFDCDEREQVSCVKPMELCTLGLKSFQSPRRPRREADRAEQSPNSPCQRVGESSCRST